MNQLWVTYIEDTHTLIQTEDCTMKSIPLRSCKLFFMHVHIPYYDFGEDHHVHHSEEVSGSDSS
jgi:hypothetical protein